MEDRRNTLYYGDNLLILREHIPSESVDLIYLDPSFNSNRSYNVLFKDEHGSDSQAQIKAFDDTWHWGFEAENTYDELITSSQPHISAMIQSMRDFVGSNQMMAYLVMMATRLIELHRVLKPTGSLYLHCDPTSSHYLKVIMDVIFGKGHFKNEIIWHYKRWPAKTTRFQRMHDVILFYAKEESNNTFNILLQPLSEGTNRRWNGKKSRVEFIDGVRQITKMTDEQSAGAPLDDVWEIPVINSQAKERLGYPTQKPLALLERIIQASSKPGDLILDPFCGCGTSVAAAEKLKRKWVGIDITHLGITAMKYRLKESFPGIQFKVVGEPKDIDAARQLAMEDRYQFQWWALSLIPGAMPLGGQEGSREGKKGADKGVDGILSFIDDPSGRAKKALIQVKSGHINSSMIRDLIGTVQREQAAIGIFITLDDPTRDMVTEAVTASFYNSPGWRQKYPVIQIYTVDELLHHAEVKMPPRYWMGKRAKILKNFGEQKALDLMPRSKHIKRKTI